MSKKVLTKDLMNKYNILNGIFLQTAYKIIQYLDQSISTLVFFSGNNKIYSWTSKGISEESIKNPSTSDNIFAPKSAGYPISKIKFNGNCLKQDSASFLHKSQ